MDFVKRYCRSTALDDETCAKISKKLSDFGFDDFNKFKCMRKERISTYFPEIFMQEVIEGMLQMDATSSEEVTENQVVDFVFFKDNDLLLEPYFDKVRDELEGGRVCSAYKNLVEFIAFSMMKQNEAWNFDSPQYKKMILEVNKWGGKHPLLPRPRSEVKFLILLILNYISIFQKNCRADVSVKINNTKAELRKRGMDLKEYLKFLFDKKRPSSKILL